MPVEQLVLLAGVLWIGKRMVLGPLPVYARTGAILLLPGLFLVDMAPAPQTTLALCGGMLLLLAFLVWMLMFASEIGWMLYHRKLPWRKSPGPDKES